MAMIADIRIVNSQLHERPVFISLPFEKFMSTTLTFVTPYSLSPDFVM
jgi:hypothetical protein